MTCESPPPLTDIQLLTYIDGDADEWVAAHIECCAHCRQQARCLAYLQGRLTERLYRLTCPTSQELGEYHLGMLSHEQAAAIVAHLNQCPHCAREVAQLKDFMDTAQPELEITSLDRVRILIAELIRGRRQRGPQGALALSPALALRGEQDEPYIFQAGQVQVTIQVQQDPGYPDHAARKILLGLVTGIANGEWDVQLYRAGCLVASVPVDVEQGSFEVSELDSGSYELILSSTDVEIHNITLEI